jgi:hypothetical protein
LPLADQASVGAQVLKEFAAASKILEGEGFPRGTMAHFEGGEPVPVEGKVMREEYPLACDTCEPCPDFETPCLWLIGAFGWLVRVASFCAGVLLCHRCLHEPRSNARLHLYALCSPAAVDVGGGGAMVSGDIADVSAVDSGVDIRSLRKRHEFVAHLKGHHKKKGRALPVPAPPQNKEEL